MKTRVLQIVTCIILFIVCAIANLCIAIFRDNNKYEIKCKDFESIIEYNGELDLNNLSIYNKKDKKVITSDEFKVVSCDNTDTIGNKILVIEYDKKQFKIKFQVKYKIEFCLDDEIISTQYVNSAEEIVVPENVTKTGYEFISWSTEIPKILEDNIKLEAKMSSTTLKIPNLNTLTTEYGTTLSQLQLPYNNNGKWVFVDDLETKVGNVGTRTFDVKFIPNTSELAEKYDSISITVLQKTLEFTITQNNFIYDGYPHFPTYTLPVHGIHVEEIGNAETKASNTGYDFSLIINDSNYFGYYSGSYKINKADVTLEIKDKTVDYGSEFTLDYEIKGFENEDVLNLTFDNYLNLNAGMYEIGAKSNNPNINLTVAKKANLTVNKIDLPTAPVNPTLSTISTPAVYGDKLSTIAFENNFATGFWTWQDPNCVIDKINDFSAIAMFTPYSSNYNVETRNLKIENISKKELLISVTENTYTYDGSAHSISYAIEDGKYRNLSVVGNLTKTNAGKYETTLSIDNEFYQGSVKTELLINKATPLTDFSTLLTATWFSNIKLSDIDLCSGYSWKNSLTDLEVGTSRHSAVYTPTDTNNYNQVNGEFEVTINKKDASIGGVQSKYTYVYTGNAHRIKDVFACHYESSLEYIYYLNGLKVDSLTNAGNYNVIINLPESKHYNQVQNSTTVLIEKADIDVQLSSLTSIYEDCLGDVMLPKVENGTWNWKESDSTSVGLVGEQKHIAIFTPTNENYNNVEFEATINVEKKNLNIIITNNVFDYDGKSHKINYIINDNNQKDYSSLETTGNLSCTNAGRYDLTISVSNENYNAIKSTQLIINKAKLTPELPQNITATYLDCLSDVKFREYENGTWNWLEDKDTLVGNVGNNKFKAIFIYNEHENCDNFEDYETELTINISKKIINTPKLESNTAIYTGSTILADICDTDMYKVTENGWLDVDDYNVKLTLNDSDNYRWDNSEDATIYLPFSITPAQAIISQFSMSDWTYNETASSPTAQSNFGTIVYSYSNIKDGIYTQNKPTDAGSYYIKAEINEHKNYFGTFSILPFNINKISLVDPSIDSKIYTGERLYADIPQSEIYDIENLGGTNIGFYDVILTIVDPNYQWANSTTNKLVLSFEITSAINEWSTDPTMPNWTYNETPEIPNVTSKFGTVSILYKPTNTSDENYTKTLPTLAGDYIAKYSVAGTTDYGSLLKIISFTIYKAEIEIPSIKNLTYTGNPLTAEISSTDIYSIDHDSSVLTATNQGTYTISLVIIDSNYKWSSGSETTETTTFTIEQANNSISNLKMDSWTYGEIKKSPSAIADFGNINYTYSTKIDGEYVKTKPTDAGTYYVKAEVVGNNNYASASEIISFTINQASNSISNFKMEGWTFGEVANSPSAKSKFGTITYTYSTKIDGEYVKTKPTDAGTYYVKAEVVGNDNYTSTRAIEIFEIQKAEIEIPEVDNQTYTGNPLIAEISSTDIYTIDHDSSVLTATNQGTYTITLVIIDSNYKWSSGSETTETTTFTIEQASNSISNLKMDSWTYGEIEKSPSAQSIFGTVVYSYSTSENGVFVATKPTDAGTYYVKAEVVGNNNYASVSELSSFTIYRNKAEITNFEFNGWTYTEKQNNPIIAKSNFVNDNDVVYYFKKENENWSTTKAENVGIYSVKAVIPTTDNYDGCESLVLSFEIKQPEITLVAPTYPTIYINVDDISSSSTQLTKPNAYVTNNQDFEVQGNWSYENLTYVHGDNKSYFKLTFTPTNSEELPYNSINFPSKTIDVYLTVKSVAFIGSTYYPTIESALDQATSGIIYVPADANGITITRDCEIKSGVTLSFLHGSDTSSRLSEKAASLKDKTYADFSNAKRTSLININANVKITNYGTIEVAGELSGANGGAAYAGHTAGNYVEILMDTNSSIYSEGNIKINGYINSKTFNNGSLIEVNNGEIALPFVLHDYRGGSYMYAAYFGEKVQTGTILGFIPKYERFTKEVAPFNQYQFRNISSKLKVNYTSKIYTYVNLYASYSVQYSKASLVGDSEEFMIQLHNNSYLEALYNPNTEVCDLDFFGGFTLNSLKINVSIAEVDTSSVYFPLNCYFDISLNATSNAENNFNVVQKLKMLPGSKLTIGEGVTATFGNISIYDSSYEDTTTVGTKYPKLTVDAELIVNGTMICDNVGGKIKSNLTGATVEIKNGYELTTYETTGTTSGSSTSATINFIPITYTASLISGIANVNPATPTDTGVYTYTDGQWVGPT